jgi:hypothetical protein
VACQACPHLCTYQPLQVTKQQLFESGEGEFFEWSGLVVSKDVWRRKEIRSHTKHVYVQRK